METLWLVTPAARQASGECIDDVLRQRVAGRGMEWRWPLAGRFPRHRVEVVRAADALAETNRLYDARGWTDGLPVVPPTLARVEALVRASGRGPNEAVAALDPLKGVATVERIAANAVMAGCGPAQMPVLLACVEALADPAFNLNGVQTTDENVTPLVVVSGPGAAAAGVHGGFGALGPGWRGNATIGRALRLLMTNVGGGWPAVVAFAGIGQPGRYTLCFAEPDDLSPWPPLRVELGFAAGDTIVALWRAESAVNVTGGLADLASVMASATSVFAMVHSGRVLVLVAPYVARELADRGLSKEDAKAWLWRHARMPATAWRETWLASRLIGPERWPDWLAAAEAEGAIPPVRSPDDIAIVVAGGDIPIPQSVYFPSWGFPPALVVRRVAPAAAGGA